MEVGKLKNETLGAIVLSEIKAVRDDILIRPGIGEDCTAVSFGDVACVLTTDPITGSGSQLGKLAVHVCLNDLASSGAEPVGLLLTLLCPEGTQPNDIQGILREANEAANNMGVEIIGGHTEITSAVNRTIVSATAVGKTNQDSLVKTSGAQVGDYIYMTKQAATEGTAIIAFDKSELLRESFSPEEIREAQQYIEQISVVKEGLIASKIGVSAMHDATEGGILGAVHELCEASSVGCRIHKNQINISTVTDRIATFFGIDPLKLISSGTMIITLSPEKAGALEVALKASEVPYSKIGVVTEGSQKILVWGDSEFDEMLEPIESPESDELYKVIK